MKFKEYPQQERDDWRNQEVTKAYMHALEELALDEGDASIAAIRANELHAAAVHAGTQEGVRWAIDFAEGK